MASADLTVWSVFWGDKYHKGYVYALRDAVSANLTVPHTFRCITTTPLEGIETVNPAVSYPGWWQKIGLFSPLIASGPSLYFDLDVVIVGNLDYLAEYAELNRLCAPANWAQSGHGGIQSSVMAWAGNWHKPYRAFSYPKDAERLWGDQEFLWELMGDDWVRIPRICSYKYHCRQGIPNDARVIVFHGKPDPHEVSDPWILPFTSMLHSHIRLSTASGSAPAFVATG